MLSKKEIKKIKTYLAKNELHTITLLEEEDDYGRFSNTGCDVLDGGGNSVYKSVALGKNGKNYELEVCHEVLSYCANGE